MENSVIGHTTPAAGDVGGALTAAESGTGIWDGDLGRGEETLFRQSEIFPGNVGLSMISYTETQKIKESSFRREPVKWTHRKVIVIAKMNSKLCFEVLK